MAEDERIAKLEARIASLEAIVYQHDAAIIGLSECDIEATASFSLDWHTREALENVRAHKFKEEHKNDNQGRKEIR